MMEIYGLFWFVDQDMLLRCQEVEVVMDLMVHDGSVDIGHSR